MIATIVFVQISMDYLSFHQNLLIEKYMVFLFPNPPVSSKARSPIAVLPFFLVFLQLFLVFPSIPPTFPRELLVFLVSLKSFCFFRCTPAFLEALLISMVFLMRAPDFSPVPPDKHEAFLVLIPCVRCLHSCSILPVI